MIKNQIFTNGWNWYVNVKDYDVKYGGQPYIINEYGGTYLQSHFPNKPFKQLVQHISDFTKVMTHNPKIAGYNFTQLTDVFHEINGIYTFHTELKCLLETIKMTLTYSAAIEKE